MGQADLRITFAKASPQCLLCRGTKMLCGRSYCPILARGSALAKSVELISDLDFNGASPPGVFIGRYGYPNVYAGPLLVSTTDDPSFYDSPDQWHNISIFDLIALRSSLIRGKFKVNIHGGGNRMLENVQELALSSTPADVEVLFEKKPSGTLVVDEDVQPMGPSAEVKDMKVYSARGDTLAERVAYDTDLKAQEGIVELYGAGLSVYRIQKVLSAGLLGTKAERKLVPTRWAITAVDDTTSKAMLEKIREFPEISEYRLYTSESMDNTYMVLLMPGKWEYELVEAWYPGSTWNAFGSSIEIYSSHEGYRGRKTYAEIGGCYYAARLAVAEALMRLKRQARVVILREAREGYILPVGVWHVRENVRRALSNEPKRFDSLEGALKAVSSIGRVALRDWITHSSLLFDSFHRTSLLQFT
ncbi:MAG: Nre family DNA repair protein [Candidatus Marsarchaeota archaeon]